MEIFALESNRRAIEAIDAGRFKAEIVPLAGVEDDEPPRRGTSLESMASLKTLKPGGRLTAAVSSQYGDASAALLIASAVAVKTHGLKPPALASIT
ncbi:MAG: hypothetical protein WDN69_14260 [Aliidongia sp.]